LPHWGFYETCWSPWPFPPDWTHCPTPPPAAFVALNPLVNPNLPQQPIQPRPPTTAPRSPQTTAPPPTIAPPPGPAFPNISPELPQPNRLDSRSGY
jgi:hypothetical protein